MHGRGIDRRSAQRARLAGRDEQAADLTSAMVLADLLAAGLGRAGRPLITHGDHPHAVDNNGITISDTGQRVATSTADRQNTAIARRTSLPLW
jgi:hypothetical protein